MNKLLAALLLLTAQPAAADTLSGRVVSVANGDTLTVLDQDREQHTIRLSGIDAPEKPQAYGQRSKQSLSALAYGRSVSVEWWKRDRYGRIVGKVLEGGRDVNFEQVRRGMAWHYKYYQGEQDADRARYADAEIEARTARRGLWADHGPIPPWEWRHRVSSAYNGETFRPRKVLVPLETNNAGPRFSHSACPRGRTRSLSARPRASSPHAGRAATGRSQDWAVVANAAREETSNACVGGSTR